MKKVGCHPAVASRLELLQSHDALIILRHSLRLPAMLHVLRTAPCAGHPNLSIFDDLLHDCLSRILNVQLDDKAWQQASLPIKAGGLGIRRVSQVAPSAFLASCMASESLSSTMLPPRLHSGSLSGLTESMLDWQVQGGTTL